MCGINGIFNFDDSAVCKNELEKMNNEMIYRGPDSDGFYVEKNFGMSMRRLSIIDLDTGDQPLSSEDGRYRVIMNGEIYNYIELRSDLINKGHKFLTNSDTEVIIHLYIEYSEKFLDYLEGMFAIAIFDSKTKKLIVARDRLGIKPLYYYYNEKKLIFSSSLDSIISLNKNLKNINLNSFYSLISLSYVASPDTIWSNIYKLMPAHYIKIKEKKIHIQKYWDINEFNDNDKDYNYYKEKIKHLLENSIKLHARSDVPVGTYLSGGIDSSVVTSLFSEYTNQQFHSFSIDFEDKVDNESYFAKLVSEKYNTIHHSYKINYQQAHQELIGLLPNMDEPISDSAIISSSFLSARARENGVKVMLSGAGGDEIFGGYRRHYGSKRRIFSGSLSFLRELNLSNFIHGSENFVNILTLLQSKPLAYALSTSGINLKPIYKCLNDKKLFQEILKKNHNQFQESFNLGSKSQINKFLFTDINNYLLDNVLALTDKTSMSHSVEARVPFLDHNLVQTAIIATSNFFVNSNFKNSKRFLKDIVSDKLPSQVLNRKKVGFNSPMNLWIKKMFKLEYNNKINLKTELMNNIFDTNEIFNLLNIKDDKNEYSEFLFMIFVFDNWLDKKL